MQTTNKKFLKLILGKTTSILPGEKFTIDTHKGVVWEESIKFKDDYKICPEDWRKIQSIINNEFFLVLPKENAMEAIEGYIIVKKPLFGRYGEVILAFGEHHLPPRQNLKDLFYLCHSYKNRFLLFFTKIQIKKKFEDYEF